MIHNESLSIILWLLQFIHKRVNSSVPSSPTRRKGENMWPVVMTQYHLTSASSDTETLSDLQ